MQHVGILSVVLYWTLVWYVITKDYKGPTSPISNYVTEGHNRRLYVLVSTISFVSFYTFSIAWLLPAYELTTLAYAIISVSFVLQIMTTMVPRTTPKNTAVHDWTARLSGFFAVLLLPFFAVNSLTSELLSVFLWLLFATLFGVGVYIRHVNRKNFLPLQIGLFGTFNVIVLILAYSV